MKRKIGICLLSCLLLFCMPLQTLGAGMHVSQPGEVKKGDTFTLELKISETVCIKAGGVLLTYDRSMLTVVDYQWNLENPMLQSYDKEKDAGVFAYGEPVELTGLIFTATLKVKDDAPYGDAGMLTQLKFINSNAPENNVTYDNVPSEIYVSCMDHKTENGGSVCTICGRTMQGTTQAPTQQEVTAATEATASTQAAPDVPADSVAPEETKPDKEQVGTESAQEEEPVVTIGAARPEKPDTPVEVFLVAGAVLLLAVGIFLVWYKKSRRS